MNNVDYLFKLALRFERNAAYENFVEYQNKYETILTNIIRNPPFVEYVWDNVFETNPGKYVMYIDVGNKSLKEDDLTSSALSHKELHNLVIRLIKVISNKLPKAQFNIGKSKMPINAEKGFNSLELKVIIPF